MFSSIKSFFIITYTVLLANSIMLNSQPTQEIKGGKISGHIVEKSNSKNVISANVILLKEKDSSIVRGVISDEKGNFTLSAVPFGKYILKITYVGFSPYYSSAFSLNKQSIDKLFGKIEIGTGDNVTDEVVVTAERQAIEYSAGKKVFNVDKNLVGTGGSSLDVLRNVPAIEVDVDNNISLRGSTNVTILIDGRPAGIMGNLSTILAQIPANAIDKIEVITNPTSKYDAEGMSGVINIITKRELKQGLNGLINTNASTYDNYNASTNLNYRSGFVNLFTNLDYNISHNLRKLDISRTSFLRKDEDSYYTDSADYFKKYGDRYRTGGGYGAKIGAEFSFSKVHTLTVAASTRKFEDDQTEFSRNEKSNTLKELTNLYVLRGLENSPSLSQDFSANYYNQFSKGHELTWDNYFSINDYTNDFLNRNITYNVNNTINDTVPILKLNNITKITSKTIISNMDYVKPLASDTKIEGGLKFTNKQVEANYDVNSSRSLDVNAPLVRDNIASNHAKYNESVLGAYTTFTSKLFDIDYMLGVRMEQTHTSVSEITNSNDNYDKSYLDFFPNVNLSYKISDFEQFQLTFSGRINRPRMTELNPFIDKSDPTTWRTGNTKLTPEYTNSFEFGYLKTMDNLTLNMDVFFRKTSDVINNRFMERDTTFGSNIIFMKPVNMATGQSYGTQFNVSYEPVKAWRNNLDVSVYQQKAEGSYNDIVYKNDAFGWSAKLMSTATIWEDINVQLMLNYSSPTVSAQGSRNAFYMSDLGFRKEFLDKKLSVSLRWTDLFNTMRFGGQSKGPGFEGTASFYRDYRLISLGISYKINDLTKTKEKRKPQENNGGGGDDY